MRNTFVNTLIENAKINKDLFLVTGDLGFNVLTKFWNEYPDRFINAGICEQNMTSLAAGMALEGKTVFTYSIANFPTLRCLEQIRNDVCYHKADVKIVAIGGGFSYGALGMSHHATEDIAIMRSLPELIVFTPCDPIETEAAVNLAIKIHGPCYIRLGKGMERNIHKNPIKIELGKAIKIKDGQDIAIFAAGNIISEALYASEILDSLELNPSIYSFPTVKPIDKDTIIRAAKDFRYIFTLEEHNVIGGFGSAISEILAEIKTEAIQIKIGINDIYSSEVGSQDYLRKYYGIDKDSIINKIKSFHKHVVYKNSYYLDH